MIDGRRVLGLIVARGGSKGLPRKNLLPLGGRPMVTWSVAAAAGSALLDSVVISTDDPEIAEAARGAGAAAPFLRPAELATDTASVYDAIRHALETLEERFDLVALLQATSPLRRSADVDAAIRALVEGDATTCVSVTPTAKSPFWQFYRDDDGGLTPILDEGGLRKRRQDLPPCVELNGAVYVATVDWLATADTFLSDRTVSVMMPRERSVDIDTAADYAVAQALLLQE